MLHGTEKSCDKDRGNQVCFLESFVIAQEFYPWRSGQVDVVFLDRKTDTGCNALAWIYTTRLLLSNYLSKLGRYKLGCIYFALIPDLSMNWWQGTKWKYELVYFSMISFATTNNIGHSDDSHPQRYTIA